MQLEFTKSLNVLPKKKINPSLSVWHFWLDISQNSRPNYFCRDLFLFGALRARFFLCTGISVARRRQSTKSQVTIIFVNRGLVARRWIVSPSCARGKKGGGGAGERKVRAGRSPRGKLPQRVGRSRTTRSLENSGYQNCQTIVLM